MIRKRGQLEQIVCKVQNQAKSNCNVYDAYLSGKKEKKRKKVRKSKTLLKFKQMTTISGRMGF